METYYSQGKNYIKSKVFQQLKFSNLKYKKNIMEEKENFLTKPYEMRLNIIWTVDLSDCRRIIGGVGWLDGCLFSLVFGFGLAWLPEIP